MTPDGPEPRRFRLRFWVVLLIYLVAAQLDVLLGSAVLWAVTGRLPLTGPRVLQLQFGVKVAVAVAATGFMAGLLWALWWVRVGPAGVEMPRSYGPVAWDSIREARLHRLFGLPYVRLLAGHSRVVRVPLVLADLPGFVAAVEEFAGPDHPLTRTLCEWMDGD